ncbi:MULTISPECIES: enoyl-CoA hydratase/isomerase family protein [unclassified Haladaptatus]|uniref:enoyl-CoA hydratase/isomerase family protein n=1 Tax=unclassified Haladaptatus TaxID=2622732 RepID=UPI0023E8A431|nr:MULTISPECIES: enoyl-CoA hydratase/isomerase family protein [unclassified Haladaptatus]
MSTYEHLDYREERRTAVITFDRASKMNTLHGPAIDELDAALERAESNEDLRAVVLTGNERAFSAGYDINDDSLNERDLSVADWLELMESYTHIRTIYELDLPVIAAVDGYALAGGCNTALVSDLTIATDRAKLGYPDVRMGGLPGTFVHPFVMGSLKHARELFYSGKMVSGQEAERFGMVNRSVPQEELMDEVWEEIKAIRKTPKPVVQITKHMLNDVMEAQGYRPGNKHVEHLASLTSLSEYGQQYYQIRDEEGFEAALDWMHEENKP